MPSEKTTCPICQGHARRADVEGHHRISKYWGCRCGSEYYLDPTELEDWVKERGVDERSRLGALLYERSTREYPPAYLQFDIAAYRDHKHPNTRDAVPLLVPEWVSNEWPRTVPEQLNRSLCNLARKSERAGSEIHLDQDLFVFFTMEPQEWHYVLVALRERDWVRVIKGDSDTSMVPRFDLQVTPKGWERFEELTAGRPSPENPAFVAMWFGGKGQAGEMSKLYHEAIEPAVKDAWYRVKRADSEEHNDYIMDKIRGDIRQAPFVVAELTAHNQGVYYEAGFAAGLGIPVIFCCPEPEAGDVHFDVEQVKQIRWQNTDDLRKQLTARILGSIGRGPYDPAE